MDLPSFPVEALDLPDEKLGFVVWAWFLQDQANRRRVATADLAAFSVKLMSELARVEYHGVHNAALAIALKRIASGDVAGGAAQFREYMRHGAATVKLVGEQRRMREARRAGGQKRAAQRRAATASGIAEAERALLKEKKRPSNKAVARIVDRHPDTIRKARRKTGVS